MSKFTTTVAAWRSNTSELHGVTDAVSQGDYLQAINGMIFYGDPSREKFGDWVRVGEAEITVTLLPREEMAQVAVEAAKRELEQARAEWLTKQSEIMERISKLQALTYEVAA